ncbi:MAG: hypothetical protein GY757_42200 [bacterium]|nr:hypothetical protein [bacterium]
MKKAKGVIKLEIKRNLNKFSIAGILLFVLLTTLLIQFGISKYKSHYPKGQDFKIIEQQKVQRYINYMQYGSYGFLVKQEPSPLYALFYNSTTFSELITFIDNGVRLKIKKPQIGKIIFEKPTGSFLDFSWFLLVLSNIIVSIWGFRTFRNKEYLCFVEHASNSKRVLLGILTGRIIVILTILSLILCTTWLQFLINGIGFAGTGLTLLPVSFLAAALVSILILLISAICGCVKKTIIGGTILSLSWFIIIFLLPEMLALISEKTLAVNIKGLYKHELQKTDILMAFEKKALQNTGRYTSIPEKKESDKKAAEEYWNIQFKQIESLENEMIKNTGTNTKRFHYLSIFSPVTFFKSVNNELSSRGYNGYMAFYRYCKKHQKGFLHYYLKKRFSGNYGRVEPYLAPGENIFAAKSSWPAYFYEGLALNIFYLIFFFRLTLYISQKALLKPGGTVKDLQLDMESGQFNFLLTGDTGLKNQALNFFQGQGDTYVEAGIDGAPIADKGFIYLPDPAKLPGNITPNLLNLFLLGKLPEQGMELWEILFEFAEDSGKIIILDEFFKSMNQSGIKEVLNRIYEGHLKALYISGNYYMGLKIGSPLLYSPSDKTVEVLNTIQTS